MSNKHVFESQIQKSVCALTEKDYERLAKEYLSKANVSTQKRGAFAIKRLLNDADDPRSWRWIYIALKKKSISEWENWGFGLMFNRTFIRYVYSRMDLEEEMSGFDLDGFYSEDE